MELFKRILCAVDFDGNSLEALRMAKRIALREEADLCLLHVVPPTDPLTISAPLIARRHEEEGRAELARLAATELAEVKHETRLVFGHPPEEILDAAKDFGADLLVMATHGRHGLAHMVLGSVAEKVVREARCPVLTIRLNAAAG
jgi:nucleotide-binding universal stress UspA family protein